MKKHIIIGVCALCILTVAPAWAASPFVGGWDVQMTRNDRPMDAKLVIKGQGGSLSGVWVTPRGKETLQSVTASGGTLSFVRKLERQDRSIEIKHTATIKDGKLVGQSTTRRGTTAFAGKRAKDSSETFSGRRGRGGQEGREGRPPRFEDGERPPRGEGGPDGEGRQRGTRGEGGDRQGGGGQNGPRDLTQLLNRLDANGDGKLQESEAPERMAEHFGRLDRDGDGALDSSELEHAKKQRGKRQGEKPQNQL